MSDEAPVPLAEQPIPTYETNVSDERLDVILSNECGAPPGLATSRFRRLANEIAAKDKALRATLQQHERAMAALRLVIAQAGIPDPGDACRAIIKTAQAALDDAARAAGDAGL